MPTNGYRRYSDVGTATASATKTKTIKGIKDAGLVVGLMILVDTVTAADMVGGTFTVRAGGSTVVENEPMARWSSLTDNARPFIPTAHLKIMDDANFELTMTNASVTDIPVVLTLCYEEL